MIPGFIFSTYQAVISDSLLTFTSFKRILDWFKISFAAKIYLSYIFNPVRNPPAAPFGPIEENQAEIFRGEPRKNPGGLNLYLQRG